jgi:hypothetical protein
MASANFQPKMVEQMTSDNLQLAQPWLRPRERTDPNMSNTKPYPKTYRVQGIPSGLTKDQSKQFLRLALGANSELRVHSLSPDPYSSYRSVATITLRQIPSSLQGDRDQWTMPVQINDPNSGGSETVSITVDTHFLGFTPVSSVKDGPDHRIE